MKTFLTTFVSLVLSFNLFAQQHGEEMPPGASAIVQLDKVTMAYKDGLQYSNFDGSKNNYYIKVEFGKSTLNIELYETATKKLVWATYHKRSQVNFKLNREKSHPTLSYYEWIEEVRARKTKASIYISGTERVSFSYSITNPTNKREECSFVAGGQ